MLFLVLLAGTFVFVFAQNRSTKTNGVDLDLTRMSKTFIYSQIFNMMAEPESFVGKTIRVKGQFASYDLPEGFGRKKSFAVLVQDATACCQQGIEFIWEGNHVYPRDYPDEGKDITVTGVFEMYKAGVYDCFCIRTSDVQF